VNHLKIEQQADINKLKKYRAVFAKDKYDIETVKNYEAWIDLIIDKYCCKRPYRCAIEDKKEIEQQITKLLGKNLSGVPKATTLRFYYRLVYYCILMR